MSKEREAITNANVSGEALVVRGRTDERKPSGKRGISRSKSRGKFPAKDECAFCRALERKIAPS